MALDTYTEVWNRVLLRCPALDPKLSQDLVKDAFRRLAEMRRWSWLVKFGQFIAPQVYSTGTVTVTQNSTTVTGSGTTFTAAMVGRQFRVGLAAPIYTIAQYVSATEIALDSPWGGPSGSAQTFMIYQCFFTPPSDFHQFITLWDPAFNWQLYLDVQQAELNVWDAQRANVSNAYVVSFRDYTTSQVGVVNAPLQVLGSGSSPISAGVYLGPVDATFTIEVTTGGAAGTAVYKWKKNNGSYTTLVTTDPNGFAQDLQDGVQVAFPLGFTYTVANIWVIQCTAISNAGLPRYELWPHQQANKVYPFLYESRAVDLNDINAVLPRYIRGDVLLEMALAEVALWPGYSPDQPNIYRSDSIARAHAEKSARMIQLLEVQDDEVYMQNLTYLYPSMAWAYATPLGDASWLQSHAI